MALWRKETCNLRRRMQILQCRSQRYVFDRAYKSCTVQFRQRALFLYKSPIISGSLAERDLTNPEDTYNWPSIHILMMHLIPLGWTFSNAVSKLKVRTSLLPLFNGKRRSNFELWALQKLSGNVTPNGIDCTYTDYCMWRVIQHTAAHCSTLQHTATHCNTLQHTATHTATHCNTLQHTATRCNTLQHAAIHCITLHHTASHCNSQHCMWSVIASNPQISI